MIVLCLLAVGVAHALYDGDKDVVELTASSFQSKVVDSDAIWIVEFYAPWCGHCQQLAPEYKKAARALKGVVKVGAVDMDTHQNVGAPYNIRGFPTIKIFGENKQKPADYNGQRTAQGLVNEALNEVSKVVKAKLSGKSSGGGGGGGRKEMPKGDEKDVVELTDSNFQELVLNSDDMWLVEFFAPWCGHCKNLAPHWASAATHLKGKVKLGALDATTHTVIAGRYGIRGFPTIKYFPAGKKDEAGEEYDGGRTADSIVEWALGKAAENIPPPEVIQVNSQDDMAEMCEKHPICVVAVLPHILDCQSKCRNEYIDMLKQLGDKFKKNMWGWGWTEAVAQQGLEDAFGIGGFGYPAMAALNAKKMKFAILRGPFSYDGINEFLRELSYGRGSTAPLKGASLPKISKAEPWDGKDGEEPQMEDIDLDDVFDDDKTEKKKEEL